MKNLSNFKWYERIEKQVKEIVYILRNNGFNTTCSCAHDMYIEIDVRWDQLEELYNCLAENWGDFYIEFYWEGHTLHRQWAIVYLGNRNA